MPAQGSSPRVASPPAATAAPAPASPLPAVDKGKARATDAGTAATLSPGSSRSKSPVALSPDSASAPASRPGSSSGPSKHAAPARASSSGSRKVLSPQPRLAGRAVSPSSTRSSTPRLSASTSGKPSKAGSRASHPGSRSSLESRRIKSPSPSRPPAPTNAVLSDSERQDLATTLAHKKRLGGRLLHRRQSSASGSSADEGDWTREDIAHAKRAEAAACAALKSKHVELVFDGRTVHTEAELGDATVPGRSYVWEIMYENQRGMTFFGKSWYSSNTLLPSDPTPFTLPQALPATEVTEAGPGSAAARTGFGGRKVRTTAPKRNRESIDTAYTLQTYQTPSPAWVWLTPWMVNMRTKTDEQGWEYNLWFHRTRWRPHPGHLNWWGWVRRREWVRLRGLVPEIIEKANEEVREAVDDFWGDPHEHDHSHHTSRPQSDNNTPQESSQQEGNGGEVQAGMDWDGGDAAVGYLVKNVKAEDDAKVREDTEARQQVAAEERAAGDEQPDPADQENNDKGAIESDRTSTTTNASDSDQSFCDPKSVSLALLLDGPTPIGDMVGLLATKPLDRQKLEALLRWIDEAGPGDVDALKALLEEPENLDDLGRAFVFSRSRNAMFAELTSRNLIPQHDCNRCMTPSAERAQETDTIR